MMLECPFIGKCCILSQLTWMIFTSIFSVHSFDVRGKSMTEAIQWSDATVFGTRAKFITQSEPAFLEIDVS